MRVTLYKSTDGKLFETHEEFAKHEASLKIAQAADTAEFNTDAFSDDDRGNRVLFLEDIPAFVADNADKLRAILNDAVVVKRGRKAKSEQAAAPSA